MSRDSAWMWCVVSWKVISTIKWYKTDEQTHQCQLPEAFPWFWLSQKVHQRTPGRHYNALKGVWLSGEDDGNDCDESYVNNKEYEVLENLNCFFSLSFCDCKLSFLCQAWWKVLQIRNSQKIHLELNKTWNIGLRSDHLTNSLLYHLLFHPSIICYVC